jgi:hypothetical protein
VETLRGNGRDQGLFIRKMRVGCGVADAGLSGHAAQAERANAIPRQDLNSGLDQRILQVTVVVGVVCHALILTTKLDIVKIAVYNLDTVKIQRGGTCKITQKLKNSLSHQRRN